jgi:hypothetical protein
MDWKWMNIYQLNLGMDMIGILDKMNLDWLGLYGFGLV